MQEHDADQSLNRCMNKRQPWRVRLGLLGVAGLLFLALASAVANHLVPKVPERAPGVTARMGWYLHSGQLRADVHTLAAALQFFMTPDGDTPTVTNLANPPVADNVAPSSPKS